MKPVMSIRVVCDTAKVVQACNTDRVVLKSAEKREELVRGTRGFAEEVREVLRDVAVSSERVKRE